MKKIVFIYTALSLLAATTFGQVNSGLLTTISAIAGMRDRFPIEKLHLQLDKPYYALGDTIRFKAYLLNADFLKPSIRSGLLYVEMDAADGKMVKRIMVPLIQGLGWGDMALVDKDFPEGSYTLRAYTNWMLNFGDDYVFKKNLYISALSGSTLVKANFKLQTGSEKDKVNASLLLFGLDKSPFRLKDMQLEVLNGKHSLLKDKATTGIDGSLQFSFDADKTAVRDLSITAQEIRKTPDETPPLIIPVLLNRAENTDVQFMPEGGNMIAGLPVRVGFKALSEDGRGTEVSGKVLNSKQQEVAVFGSSHKGMGSFELVPQAGEVYSAKVVLAGGLVKTYPLPAVSTSGTALRVTPKGNDSLEITLSATPDLLGAATYYLFGETRGLVCYTAAISFKRGVVKKTVDKGSFPTGIAHFTLFNQTNQPVNERIVYIAHNDNLRISITPDKDNYGIRDSMAVALSVKDAAGKPVRGSFSVAVTDDSQVRADSLGNNLVSDMLLTSDLKGTVEEPGWYFESTNAEHTAALDNLLLTQGWIGYDWKAIFNPVAAQPQFPAELKFLVEGRVTNVFNKGVEKSQVLLFSGKPQMMKQTETDKDGKFAFNDLFPVDTAQFKIQARNKAGKSFNVGIEILNQFKPPVFTANGSVMPWYVNTDNILLNNSAIKARQQQARADLVGEGHMLKEVVINEKKSVKGSKNLNGPGQADQVMDEQDMLNAGKMTLEELLVKNVRGFMPKGGMWSPCPSCDGSTPPMGYPKTSKSLLTSYTLNNKMVHFVFDGVDVNTLYDGSHLGPWADLGQSKKDPAQDRYNFLKGYLDYFSAEDVKGIEVMYNAQFSAIYTGLGFSADENMNYGSNLAFIEITTRAGKGPSMKATPGTYLYKPLAFSVSKQFYRPRYTYRNKMADRGTDLRSTIHWAPQVVTDKDGRATVSFFSADKPADYTITVEGTDLQGNLGYARGKAAVNAVSGASTINNVKPSILSAITRAQDRIGVEKLYMQLDKPYYTIGDTLRFKGYLVDGSFLSPSTKSGLMYVELDDVVGRMIKRIMAPVLSGSAWGNIPLDEKEIPEGSYTLRAYTNWMLNFGETYIFKKNISISAVNGGSTLVKAAFKLENGVDKDKVTTAVLLTGLNGEPLRLKDMKLRVKAGSKTLFRDKANTAMDGTLHLNFDLADKTETSKLTMQLQNTGKGADTATLTIPILLNRPEKTDVQYLPEGGNLVAGISTKVGFKAISEDGMGAEITGKIVNSKQQEVARFQTTHKGMGVFELTPQAGETYTAKVNAPNNTIISYNLPPINAAGTTLKITTKGKDSLEATISASSALLNGTENYYLIGQVRGVVYYGAMISFKGIPIKKVIAKGVFPAGIAHFTLLNNTNQTLNERMVYIGHDNLQVSLAASKSSYSTRDNIAVNVMVKDKDGKPVQGNFSLAVTDGAQVSADSTSNIMTNLLLTSDLKGNVEDPGWYFESEMADRVTALDNLMLTQGWTGYDWKVIFNPGVQQPQYRAEPEFVVQGKVTDVFNKPIKKTSVTLLQKQPLLIMDAQTNDEGRFIFKGKNLFPTDTAYYLIQAKNKSGNTFNVGVDVDEITPPAFALAKQRLLPWYFNSDTTLLNNAATKMAQLKAEADYRGEGHMLKEVVIKEKKIIPDSHNRNGPGEADIIMDEKEMNEAKKMTLYELLLHKFPNFHKGPVTAETQYYLNNRHVAFVIDGVYIKGAHIDGEFEVPIPVDLYMDFLTAEDIKGIEIMRSAQYAMAYDPNFISKEAHGLDKNVPTFLEITTYSGHGAFLKHIPGRYVYKPIPFSSPKEFYSPKYTVNNRSIAVGTDLRSTIHWEPNIITGKDGKATVSFYSADMPADYTLILEGTDMNGGFGYSRQKIKVVK